MIYSFLNTKDYFIIYHNGRAWAESFLLQGNARKILIIPKFTSELLMVSAALRLKTHNKANVIYFCFEKSHLITLYQIEIMIIPVSPCSQKNSDQDENSRKFQEKAVAQFLLVS